MAQHPPRRRCSQHVFSDARGGDSCQISATVLEDGKWWCKRHTEAAKEKRKAASAARIEDYLTESRRRVKDERMRNHKAAMFEDLLAALDEADSLLRALNGWLVGLQKVKNKPSAAAINGVIEEMLPVWRNVRVVIVKAKAHA